MYPFSPNWEVRIMNCLKYSGNLWGLCAAQVGRNGWGESWPPAGCGPLEAGLREPGSGATHALPVGTALSCSSV